MPIAALPSQSTNTDLSRLYGQEEEANPNNQLGKDAFLKLLVAQLKYQDPMNPTSSEDFIATTAQFTMVEKLDELAEQGREGATVNALTTASSLIGKEITVTGSDGRPKSSIVERTQIIGGEVTVITDLGPISLTKIIAIADPGGSNSETTDGSTETVAEPTITAIEPDSTQPVQDTDSSSTSTEGGQPEVLTETTTQDTTTQDTTTQKVPVQEVPAPETLTETSGTDAVDAVDSSPLLKES